MKQDAHKLKQEIEAQLAKVGSYKELEQLKVRYLGRKGPLQDLVRRLREATTEERPLLGKFLNELKSHFEEEFGRLESLFLENEEAESLQQQQVDITLPGTPRFCGRAHPVTHVMDRVLDIHRELGFSVQYGPHIESDYYNFEALNFPPDHPARDMHDTFYIEPEILLRTHTSNTQVRVMEGNAPPIRIAAPGRCYRNEEITVRSHLFFHQVEGMYIDRGVSFSDLMQTLKLLLSRIFGEDVEVRFRPSYFPFVEPGVEVDVSCSCEEGCSLCKQSGWLEVLGAGMVHPEVLKNGGIDPEVYTGYAWGMGIERLVLLLYGIDDIRLLSDNDMRLLSQFAFA